MMSRDIVKLSLLSSRNDEENDSAPPSILAYLKHDLQAAGPFDLAEPNDQVIHLEASFVRERLPYRRVLFVRATFFILSFGVFILDWDFYFGFALIYFGYLTHWAFLCSLLYQSAILVCTAHEPSRSTYLSQPYHFSGPQKPGYMACYIWTFYTLAATTEVLIAFLYWALLYEPGQVVRFVDVFKHGIIATMILIDGNLLGSIPIRLKQFWIFEIFGILYLIWNMADQFLGIGNGDEDNEDDAIYPVLKWKGDPMGAVVLSSLVVLVVSPLVFVFTWMLSLMRRVVVYGAYSNQIDIELGSTRVDVV